MATETEIRLELIEHFPHIVADDYYEDYVRIGVFLSKGEETTLKSLKTIEGKLYAKLKEVNRSAEEAIKYLKEKKDLHYTKHPHPKDNAFSHLLTGVLREIELNHGFNSPEKLPFFGSIVDDDIFLSYVKKRVPFKDVGALSQHGEFTHRLQWCMIVSSDNILKMERKERANVYACLANYPKRISKSKNPMALWDLLVDRVGTLIPDDFRRPEMLHSNYLIHGNGKTTLPLLSALCSMRQYKRTPFNYENYVKKKTGMDIASLKKMEGVENDVYVYDTNKMKYVLSPLNSK